MPPTLVQLGIGTMVSPWPPIRSAEISLTLTPSSIERNVRYRAVSRMPAWPITRVADAVPGDDAAWLEASDLLGALDHGVERVGDNDDDRVLARAFHILADIG